jgi:hypothetical protein
MSSSRLGGRLWKLPTEIRSRTLITYPFREPGEKMVAPAMGGPPIRINKEYKRNDRRIASRTGTMTDIVSEVLGRMERNFYRDYMLDLTDLLQDQIQTDYEKLTFTPGKRYASEGCYIMQMSGGPDPVLTPRSGWALY